MKILTYPKDANPYQDLLHRGLATVGVQAAYLPERTRSQTLNLLMLPVELAWGRVRGATVFHLHWVHRFAAPWTLRVPGGLRARRWWFELTLQVARSLGFGVVWTAHNTLPHTPVFDDDLAARRRLVALSDAVVAHSTATLDELVRLGARPRRFAVVRHGPLLTAKATTSVPQDAQPARNPSRRVLGVVGRIEEYKGVGEVAAAFADLQQRGELSCDTELHIVGECRDDRLRARLTGLAAAVPGISLRLGRLDDTEFEAALRSVDVMVLMFHRITTSGSALAASEAGIPVVLPDTLSTVDLPEEAVARAADAVAAVRWAATAPEEVLSTMRACAAQWSTGWTWEQVASATRDVYEQVRTQRAVS